MRHSCLLDFSGSGEIHTLTQSPTSSGQVPFFIFRFMFDRVTINKLTFLAMPKIARFLTSIKNQVFYCVFNILLLISDLWQSFCNFVIASLPLSSLLLLLFLERLLNSISKMTKRRTSKLPRRFNEASFSLLIQSKKIV